MREFDFWSRHVKKALNEKPFHVCKKVQDRYIPGLPDCTYSFAGRQGVFEMKYLPHWPARAETLLHLDVSPAQRNQLRDWWTASYGQASVLVGICDKWFLLPWNVPRDLATDELGGYTIVSGSIRGGMRALRDVLEAGLPYDGATRLV